MRFSDWSSDVCSSDLLGSPGDPESGQACLEREIDGVVQGGTLCRRFGCLCAAAAYRARRLDLVFRLGGVAVPVDDRIGAGAAPRSRQAVHRAVRPERLGFLQDALSVWCEPLSHSCPPTERSEEHTSELQSLMRNS